jgi:hypothetical protein
MSFKALNGGDHVHSLKDDLESFIYVVLYAALRWLPVKSKIGFNGWITYFFSDPDLSGPRGGADAKQINALDRKYSSSLDSVESSYVVNWLKAAMDLHYKGGTPNPLWDDGVALREMWKGILAENLPTNDRRVNPAPDIKIREDYSLYATYTVTTSFADLYEPRSESAQPPVPAPAKRPRTQSAGKDDLHPTPRASKRPRTGREHKHGRS